MADAQVVERFLVEELGLGQDLGKGSIDHDEDLLSSSLLDSHGIVSTVSFLEESFGIEIENDELKPEHFQTINAIVAFANQKAG